MATWHIISPKYPPQRGGIGYHTAHLSSGLAAKGHTVHIWTSIPEPEDTRNLISDKNNQPSNLGQNDGQKLATSFVEPNNVTVHKVIAKFDDDSLKMISEKIAAIGGSVLLQYRPESFGGYWSHSIARFSENLSKKLDFRVLLHEPFAIPKFKLFKLHTWVAAFHQYFSLRKILKSSHQAYVTTSNWRRFLKPFKLKYPILTLPVPSNLQHVAESQKAKNLRKAFASDAKLIFGTYSSFKEPETLEILERVVVKLLREHPNWVWLALGRYSEEFAIELRERYQDISHQIQNGGELDNKALSAHLQACDIIFQPYFLGVSTRRTSLMAALYHAMPTVTSFGIRTEDLWKEMRCVKLVEWDNIGDYISEIKKLAKNPTQRADLSQAARLAYETCFSLEHNVRLLTSE
jgi:glycosyltransferase involved in cell wall biosynthesis